MCVHRPQNSPLVVPQITCGVVLGRRAAVALQCLPTRERPCNVQCGYEMVIRSALMRCQVIAAGMGPAARHASGTASCLDGWRVLQLPGPPEAAVLTSRRAWWNSWPCSILSSDMDSARSPASTTGAPSVVPGLQLSRQFCRTPRSNGFLKCPRSSFRYRYRCQLDNSLVVTFFATCRLAVAIDKRVLDATQCIF